MKRQLIQLPTGMSVEAGRDWNGRFFVVYARGASVFVREVSELRRFLRMPKNIPSRERLDAWLDSLDPIAEEPTEEPVASGFGPDNTRMVI